MKPIPEDSGSFSDIRKEGLLYVDKTSYLHRLVTSRGRKCFFLARPRRFGKSLMITTLKEIFNGRKDLFEGLDIAKTDYDWKVHPVIHLDMSDCASEIYEDFERDYPGVVRDALEAAGYTYDGDAGPEENFRKALAFFSGRGTPAVILIDEYDDPVAKLLRNVDAADRARAKLASLYGKLKTKTELYRFLMITGVSKFTKMSVFSAISNLIDLSSADECATMLGYTEADLDRYFDDRMHAQAEKMGLSYEAYRAELRRMYNGYRFWLEEGENVYNPVSINLDLAKPGRTFRCYWASTGRASTLMNLIKRGDMLALDTDNIGAVKESTFDVSDLGNLKPIGMLYQTGYLTLADYNSVTQSYKLCIPDEEVRQDLTTLFASLIADKDTVWASTLGANLLEADFDRFFVGLKSLYAGLVYGSTEGLVHEASFARNLKVLLQSQGFRTIQEHAQAGGRSDLVADHACGTYIFELKVDQPAAIAMDQAQAKAYAAPFAAANKPVWLVGLSFDRATKRYVDGVVEKVG